MNTEKRCSKCETIKLTSAFSKSAKRSDGLCVWCKQCSVEQQRLWRSLNSQRVVELNRSYYLENRDAIREAQAKYQAKHRDALRASAAERYKSDPVTHNNRTKKHRLSNPEKARIYSKIWRSRNSHAVNAKSSQRRASIRNATPAWASNEAMKLVFLEASIATKVTGIPHDVDHIVPITPPLVQSLDIGNPLPKRSFVGPLIPVVQGFHCEANIRSIPEIQNRHKSNTQWPDMPNIAF